MSLSLSLCQHLDSPELTLGEIRLNDNKNHVITNAQKHGQKARS